MIVPEPYQLWRHIETSNVYAVLALVKGKVNGDWVDGVLYRREDLAAR